MANYQQPDYRNPVTAGVTVQVEATLNPLVIVAPVPKFNQVGTTAPPGPVAGQLADAMGKSRHTYLDGHSSST